MSSALELLTRLHHHLGVAWNERRLAHDIVPAELVRQINECVARSDETPIPVSSNEQLVTDWHRWLNERGPDDCNTWAAFSAGFAAAQRRARETKAPRVAIAGDALPTTLVQFELRASRLLEDEQAKSNPDNALVSFLCDAVRLARENERLATSPLKSGADPFSDLPVEQS